MTWNYQKNVSVEKHANFVEQRVSTNTWPTAEDNKQCFWRRVCTHRITGSAPSSQGMHCSWWNTIINGWNLKVTPWWKSSSIPNRYFYSMFIFPYFPGRIFGPFDNHSNAKSETVTCHFPQGPRRCTNFRVQNFSKSPEKFEEVRLLPRIFCQKVCWTINWTTGWLLVGSWVVKVNFLRISCEWKGRWWSLKPHTRVNFPQHVRNQLTSDTSAWILYFSAIGTSRDPSSKMSKFVGKPGIQQKTKWWRDYCKGWFLDVLSWEGQNLGTVV